ncbi:MAG: asparagine synthase (glutamine-hydrolyzing), partial [Candidatus Kapabacteria bacterium]|nr:asparagine synthase (glutamine-hydrolyzing) [Candidatus Kapabacteria bacterium]
YKAWGADMLPRLNGMFAFCIYDVARKRCFMARDRFGKKPLFYTQQHETFAFASELTSLEQHECLTLERSRKALQKYFAYGYIPAPHSLYERVHKLPGGHYMTYDLAERRLDVRQWWKFEIDPYEHVPANAEEVWGEQLIELLAAAIKRRMIADVPLGFFLSGGIDSSALVALASTLIDGSKINTFSIGFTEESFDESTYSTLVAEKFGTNHTRKVLDLDTALDLLPTILGLLDEPMGDSSLLPTYLLCRETRKHVTVALGGDGADELFCGYDPFRAMGPARLYSRTIPSAVHSLVTSLMQRLPVSHRNMSLDFKIKRTLRGLGYPPHLWNAVWMGPLAPQEIDDLFAEPIAVDELYSEAIAAWEGCTSESYLDKATEFYVKLYLQDDILVKVDRASMMNSLEVRAPFLDINLVNHVRRIPASFRYRKGQSKYLLKKALEPYLPNDILYRPKKGFGVPIGKWMSEGRIDLGHLANGKTGMNTRSINDQITAHRTNTADNRAFLWNMVVMAGGERTMRTDHAV